MDDILKLKFERLKKAVLNMRRNQLEYDEYHSSNAKENARRWAKQVDDILREEIRHDKAKQPDLFGS